MKRFWVMLMMVMMCVGLCGCGGSQVDEQEPQVAAVIMHGQNDVREYTVEMRSESAVQQFCELLEQGRGEETAEPEHYGPEIDWDKDVFCVRWAQYDLLDAEGEQLDSLDVYYVVGGSDGSLPGLIMDAAGRWYDFDGALRDDMQALFYRGEGQEEVLAAKVAEMVDAGAFAGDFELIANASEDAVNDVEPKLPDAVADKECCENFWTMYSPDGRYICYSCPHHGSYMYDGDTGESWLLFEGGGAPYLFEDTGMWVGPAQWYFLPNNDMVIVGWGMMGVYNVYGECVWPFTWDDLGDVSDMQNWKDASRVPFTHTERIRWQGNVYCKNYVYDIDFVEHKVGERREIDIPNDLIIADFNDSYFVYIDDSDERWTQRIVRVDWETLEQEVLVSAWDCLLTVEKMDENGRVTFSCEPNVGNEFFAHEFWFCGEVE